MRKYLIGLTALLALIVVISVNAQSHAGYGFYTGSAMMRLCKDTGRSESAPDITSYKECVAFLTGVSDAFGMLVNLEAISKVFCPPSQVTQEQLRQAFLKYIWDANEPRCDSEGYLWSGQSNSRTIATSFSQVHECQPREMASRCCQSCHCGLCDGLALQGVASRLQQTCGADSGCDLFVTGAGTQFCRDSLHFSLLRAVTRL